MKKTGAELARLRWDKTRLQRERRAQVVRLDGLNPEQREFVFEMVRDLRAAAARYTLDTCGSAQVDSAQVEYPAR